VTLADWYVAEALRFAKAQDAGLQVAWINAGLPHLPRRRSQIPSHSSATWFPALRFALSGRKRHARGKSRPPQHKLTLTPADLRPHCVAVTAPLRLLLHHHLAVDDRRAAWQLFLRGEDDRPVALRPIMPLAG
jgi:hypothetical protein